MTDPPVRLTSSPPRPKAKENEKPDPIAAKRERTNDPVPKYLREINTVPLLTREGEVEIAKRIEKGQRAVIKALSRSPVVVAEILRCGDLLRKDDLSVKNLVEISEDEVTKETLVKRRRKVLRCINQIKFLEEEAVKVRKQLTQSRKNRKGYKRILSRLARYQIPIARLIRDLDLTPQIHLDLVDVIKQAVNRIVALEREAKS